MGAENTIKLKYKDRPTQVDNKQIEGLPQNNQEQSNNPDSKLITVIIPLISGGCWEKHYDIETTLSQIALDFRRDNNMNSIQKNHYIEYSYKNNLLDMDSTPLKSLIDGEATTIHIAQEIKSIPGTEKLEKDEIIEIVGKPFYEPFQIFTFEVKQKIIKTRNYNPIKVREKKLDKFGITSTYCNGNNHLFISGGMDPITNEIIGLFWDIDLKRNSDLSPIKMYPKKNHSMIYISKKVYIVGGDDVNTMYYYEDNKEIIRWANLNYRRFEPSLIKYDNYLFCFDTSKKYINNFDHLFNFEKIDLYSSSAEWELIKPNISPNIVNCLFKQQFFGVVKDFKDNIIFVGGIYDNDIKENINNEEVMNLQYNITKNIVEKSDVKYEDLTFTEKSFFPIDDKTSFIVPNFNKRSPKIVYFYKDKNLLETKIYHPNSHLKKKLNKIKTTQLKPNFIGLNFDMPNPQNINSIKEGPIIDNINNIDNIDYNAKNNNILQMDNYKTTSNYNNTLNNYNNNNLQIENLRITSINNEEKKDSEFNDEIDKRENNLSSIEKKDEEEEDIKNVDIDVINSQKNDNENIDINNIEIKMSDEEIIKKKDETNVIVLEKKKKEKISKKSSQSSHKEEEEEKNNSKDAILPQKEEEDKKLFEKEKTKEEKEKNDEKKEEIKNEKISQKEEEIKNKEDKKKDKSETIKGTIVPQSRNKKKTKIFYVEKPRSLINFHSSLDSPFNNNTVLINGNKMKKKIKIRNIILPKNYSLKSIKKQVRKINRTEINEFVENNN